VDARPLNAKERDVALSARTTKRMKDIGASTPRATPVSHRSAGMPQIDASSPRANPVSHRSAGMPQIGASTPRATPVPAPPSSEGMPQRPPKGDSSRYVPVSCRTSAATLPPKIDLKDAEAIYDMPNGIDDKPASPSNAELTESVLQKSQLLLKQLSDLNLDSPDLSKRDVADEETESQYAETSCSRVSSYLSPPSKCLESLDTVEVPALLLKMLSERSQAADCESQKGRSLASSKSAPALKGMDTIEVPVVFLEMLQEKWNDRHSGENLLACASLESLGSTARDESHKERRCNWSSKSSTASVMSAASTVSPRFASETESDLSMESPSQVASTSKLPPAQAGPSRRPMHLATAPVRALSPRALHTPRQLVAGAPLRRLQQSGVASAPLSSFQHSGICRRASVAQPPAQPTVSVTATVPAGSSVSVTVSTSQSIQRTHSVCVLTF
jgi:hypothetical protein